MSQSSVDEHRTGRVLVKLGLELCDKLEASQTKICGQSTNSELCAYPGLKATARDSTVDKGWSWLEREEHDIHDLNVDTTKRPYRSQL